MKMRFWQLTVLLIGVALIFSSCSPASEETGTPATTVVGEVTTPSTPEQSTPTTTGPVSTSTPEGTRTPQYGGVLTVATALDASYLDPWNGSSNTNFVAPVLEKLAQGDWGIDRDIFNFQGTKYVPLEVYGPVLAESWEVIDDTTFIVNIRKGVFWQNKAPVNGRELTASDVEYSWARNLGTGYGFTEPSPNSAWGTTIPWESIKAIDKYIIEVKISQPNLQALEIFLCEAYELSWIIPREVIEKNGDLNDWRDLVGTGPFILSDYVGGSSWVFTKNADYWGYDENYPQNKLPYLDELQILIIPDVSTRLAGLRSGKIDIEGAGNLTTSQALKQSNPEIIQIPYLNSGAPSINFRADAEPFNNPNVRKAMQMAINLEEINDSYYGGLGRALPSGQIGLDCLGYYYPYEEWDQELKDAFKYDPTEAKQLLSDEGYPNGFTTTLDICPGFLSNDADLAQIMKSYWDDIGVTVNIRTVERASFQGNIFSKSQSPMQMWYQGNNYSPVNWLKVEYYSKSAWNVLTNADPVYDQMVEKAANVLDREVQQVTSRECDKYALEQFWAIYTPRNPYFYFVNPSVGGFNGEMTLGGGTFYTPYTKLWKNE